MSFALIFGGQGAQKVGMGKSLCEGSTAACDLYNRASGQLGWDLQKVSFDGPEETLTETRVCQPALFVHGLAVVAAMREAGQLPPVSHAFGLSLGEVTALTFADVFDFSTGLAVVAERGRLMQEACEASQGGMAAVLGESRETVAALCAEFGVEPANFNGPGQIIVSGDRNGVDRLVTAAKERGLKKVISLKVAGAYHSRLMEPARSAFEKFLAGVTFRRPSCTVLSNTTAREVSSPEQIRSALVNQVVSPVLWEDCMRHAIASGVTGFRECGPGGVLAGLARRTDKAWRVESFAELADIQGAAAGTG